MLKMMNDELNGKVIGKSMLGSKEVLALKNNKKEDVLEEAIHVKSKDSISILVDIGNMLITKQHLLTAKTYINDSTKIYSLLKKRFQAQEGKYFLRNSLFLKIFFSILS